MQVPDWVDRPDLKFTPFVPALPARLAKQDDIFAQIRKGDILLHHPVRIVPAGDRLHRAGRRRPQRGRHPADGLPHRHRLQADAGADPRRAVGQGSHRGGRADGALRRGSQHQLGRQAGRSRRPRHLRRGRPQDPRQAGAGHPPRRRRAHALRASGHRQLPRPHRPSVHRLRPADLRRDHDRRRRQPVHPDHRASARPASSSACGSRRSPCTAKSSPRSTTKPNWRPPASPPPSSPR